MEFFLILAFANIFHSQEFRYMIELRAQGFNRRFENFGSFVIII